MCREMQQYIADFRVNINVSYIQIMRGKMANKILSAIQANNLYRNDREWIHGYDAMFLQLQEKA